MTRLTWNFDVLDEGIICEPHHVYRSLLGYAKGQGGPQLSPTSTRLASDNFFVVVD